MTVRMTHHIRPMRGRTQPHLMRGDNQELYIVKFQNKLRRPRQLATEFIATKLATYAGLSVPPCEIVEVSQFILDNTPDLIEDDQFVERKAGLQFGSCMVGGLQGGMLVDMLPGNYLCNVANLSEFAGIFALDKWCSNTDPRQAVFYKRPNDLRYSAYFIDQSECFGGKSWTFADSPFHGLFSRRMVYDQVTSWDSFEPFLSRLISIRLETIWTLAQEVPPEWYENNTVEIEVLIESLLVRRARIHDLIALARNASPSLFPAWTKKMYVLQAPQSKQSPRLLEPAFIPK